METRQIASGNYQERAIYTLYNEKTGGDRVLSRTMVANMERAGWIRRAGDSCPRG